MARLFCAESTAIEFFDVGRRYDSERPNRLNSTAMRINAACISQSLEEKPQKQKS
jgi:hypothetical protein